MLRRAALPGIIRDGVPCGEHHPRRMRPPAGGAADHRRRRAPQPPRWPPQAAGCAQRAPSARTWSRGCPARSAACPTE